MSFSRTFRLLALFGLLLTRSLHAQPFPNCFLNGNFTATGTIPANGTNLLDNTLSGNQCNNWVLTVWASTGVSAFSIQLEGSGAGTFTPVTVTANSGSNPATTLTGSVTTFQAMFNQFRLNLTSLTGSGSVNYRLIGAAGINPPGANASAGTGNVTIAGPLGEQTTAASVSVAVANNQAAGTSSIPTQGAAAAGSAIAGNPLLNGLSDTTNVRAWTTVNAGNNVAPAASGIGTVSAYQFLEATQVNPTAGTAGNFTPLTSDLNGNNFVRVGGPNNWTCSLGTLAASLTQCFAAPAAGLRAYITDITVDTTTGTAGTYAVEYGTGSNCGTGTNQLFPVAPTSGTLTAWTAPVLGAPEKFTFTQPLVPAAANAICVIGTATNTINIQLGGFVAP